MSGHRRFRLARRIVLLLGGLLLLATLLGYARNAVLLPPVAAGALGVALLLLLFLRRRVPARTILEVDLERRILEKRPTGLVARLTVRNALVLRDLLDAIRRAADDPRVVGLFARVGPVNVGLATVQEIRDAVLAFREKGKRAVAFAETFGEGGGGTVPYYLATAFDEIRLQPLSDLALTGLHARVPFAAGLLEKLGIVPRLDHREEHKTALYLFTEREMNEAHRETVESLLDSAWEQVVDGIAKGRDLAPDEVRALADRGPLSAGDAIAAGLLDDPGHRDEALGDLNDALRGRPLYLEKYLARAGRPDRKGPTVALIHGVGPVVRGDGGGPPLLSSSSMAADGTADAFRRAVASKRVRAILFRVSSPGGSAVASETIAREVRRAREAGKPVVVSMGDVAASGGYWVSLPADRIVAGPGTITASIGVVSGKFLTKGAWAKAGVDWDTAGRGENAGFPSPLEDYSAAGWERHQAGLDTIYEGFVARVAEARDLEPDRVREIAGGRVYTGARAKELGLVDALGGLTRALAELKEVMGLDPDRSVSLAAWPRKKGILRRFSSPDSSEEAARAGLAALAAPLLAAAGLVPSGPVQAPPLEIR